MKDQNATKLLAKVMGWEDPEPVRTYVPVLQLLADYKYDHYQRFSPGRRFIESLALWLNQFDIADRATALEFVTDRLVYISDAEFSHLVQTAYPDLIVQERIRLVAEEENMPGHQVGCITRKPRFNELRLKSLYLGLSDGARTNELRRASNGEIGNEQIWHAYELGPDKVKDMIKDLGESLENAGLSSKNARFNLIWLMDDFSGSGNTYIRYEDDRFKGKLRKIYDQLHRGDGVIDISHYEVFLLLYAATRQAVDHIEYWSERFTTENGYKPLQVRVMFTLEHQLSLTRASTPALDALLRHERYYDHAVWDKHLAVGGTQDARLGFAACALPVVLSHNTPNNSVYLLWGPESMKKFFGLFPRVSRHRE